MRGTSQHTQGKRRHAGLVLGVLLLLTCGVAAGCRRVHEAAAAGDVATVEQALKQGMDPDKKDFRNASLLHEAAAGGHLEVVELLVDHGADVNQAGDTYQKPLHFAVQMGHTQVVLYLLAQEAETSKALHETAYLGQVDVARMLLEHGVDIDEKGQDEATPLETAVTHRQVQLVEVLLANGADVNAQGLYGRTALHVAAWNDDVAVGKILLAHGADPALQCNGRRVEARSEAFRALLDNERR